MSFQLEYKPTDRYDQAPAATSVRPAEPPALPSLPRSTNLMGTDSWAREIGKVAGEFADDRSILGALGAHRRMVEAYEGLEQIRANRNPADTASRHLNRAAQAYNKMLETSARNHDAALNSIKFRREDLQELAESALDLAPSQDAGEIRTVLRGMSKQDRAAAIQAAIDAKDGAVLHAVFTGRELSTGVTEAERKSYRRRAEEKHAPKVLQMRRALDKAEALVRGAFEDVCNLDPYVAGKPEVVSEFERQTAASDNAWLKFNESLA